MPPRTLPAILAAALFGGSILPTPAGAADAPTTAGLRAEGWRVIDKHERQEKRPGVAPYENLIRVVQITTFVLESDGRRITCELAYDSQRDRTTETCRPGGGPK